MSGSDRLSIVAEFDDLVRNGSILTAGIETEFLRFVLNQEACRKKWLKVESDSQDWGSRVQGLEDQVLSLNTKLKHARGQIDHEIKKKIRAEHDRDALEQQIRLVRDLLQDKQNQTFLTEKDREKFAFLSTDFHTTHHENSPYKPSCGVEESGSLLSPDEYSFDKTEEEILEQSKLRDGTIWPRPSAPPMEPEQARKPRRLKHRRSRSYNDSLVAKATVTMEGGGTVHVTSEAGEGRKRRSSPLKNQAKRRYSAEGIKPGVSTPKGILKEANYSPESSPTFMRRFNSAGKGLNRPHVFINKTVIKPETCIPCGKRIKFGKVAVRCKDCRATAHTECKDQLPLPCVPSNCTPGNTKITGGIISDYTSSDTPMIPALVIHCVNEVESRGMREVGLYRVPGSDKEVKDLKEKFLRGRGTPNLGHIDDIHVVCGCVKDFLRGLREPLVTYSLWNDFVKAAECSDRDESMTAIYQAVSQLPQPNRDTLAFLILHLQHIAGAPDCKMPASNLARVFGPTIVGYSCAEPEPMQMISETHKQAQLLERLMSISSDYWSTFIMLDPVAELKEYTASTPQTPEITRGLPHSMLGPLPGTTDAESVDRKSWFATPLFGSKSRHVNKKPTHFFSSPVLK